MIPAIANTNGSSLSGDSSGIVTDFIPYDGTGLAAGTYQVIPLLTKGDERCRDNQPVRPAEVSIKIRS